MTSTDFVVAANENEGLDSWAYLQPEYWGQFHGRVSAILDSLAVATEKAVVSAYLQAGKEKGLLERYCARVEAWIMMAKKAA